MISGICGSDNSVLAAILTEAAEAMVVASPEGALLCLSRAATSLLGWSEDQKAGLAAALRSEDNPWRGDLPGDSGGVIGVTVRKTRVVPDDPASPIVAWITPEKERANVATIDTLTLLPNRTIFVDRLQQGIIAADRNRKSVAMLLVGVDRLSIVNNALGFGAGDHLLVELGARLSQCVRSGDTVTRLDGDNFGLALLIATVDDSLLVAEKVFQAVSKPFLVDDRELFITVSIGIALYPADATGHDDLIKTCESALRYAKSAGGNQYKFASADMNSRAHQRLELESRLRRALQQQEFLVYYQPKVSSDTSRVVGMEALVRWQDPQRGLVSPADFIPVAEETGLIIGLGHYVLTEACRQSAAWLAEGLPPLKLSVNVSARQFRMPTLVREVTDVLEASGLNPEMLELEITESMLMDNVEQTVAKFRELRALGVGLSIDDFGTGYSSLSYLGKFPITTLKIDRAFVQDVESNAKTAEIARAIIGLSKGLELEVIAEGAETLEHVEFLKDHGCLLIQGFYYSRPLPPDEFAKFVREKNTVPVG
ncbi:MAG: putative bifunctional diguanylate cyclase/phosphodiesterase [Alphaproteobacteria bacterium]